MEIFDENAVFKTTFGDAASKWLEMGRTRKRRPFTSATISGYRSYFRRLDQLIGHLLVADAQIGKVATSTAPALETY